MTPRLDFYTLNELFLNLGGIASPSEVQGMLCGRLCGGQTLDKSLWREEALRFLDLEHLTLDDAQAMLVDELHEQTLQLIADVNFRFMPMLPGEDASLTRRTQELGLWCEGFLHGLGASGLNAEAKLSAQAAEALRDLAQITQVDVQQDDELEENEVYWQELVEYVKVAVLTLYTEVGGRGTPPPEKPVVH